MTKQLFERTSAVWVRYDEYEWRSDKEGILYLTPTKTAKPGFLDPLEKYEQLVLDALDIGRRVLGKETDEVIQAKIHRFAMNYGLFGLVTALPTRPNFMDYEAVYAPSYHVALLDKPSIVWNFHSLLLGIQLMFSFMLTDDKKPIRVCKHCTTPFVASRPSAVFCSPQCKNRYNVYKSRAKKKESEDSEDV